MRKHIKTVSIMLSLLAITALPALAVPTLQLFMPSGEYYVDNPWNPNSGETWITQEKAFELQVLGATSPNWVNYIDTVQLHLAIFESELQSDFSLIINDIDPATGLPSQVLANLTNDDFTNYGIPAGLQPHGIYPTYYASVALPVLMVKTGTDTIYDYNYQFDPANPGASGHDSGTIQHYWIENNVLAYVHFDVTGIAHGDKGRTKVVNAPYSHDADDPPGVTPEPSSLLLVGIGLSGLVVRKKVIGHKS